MTERAAVVSGIGQSDVGRRLYRQPLDLTVDAALAAIEDAGLTRDDIDGLATYPGNMDTPPGFSGVGVVELQDALRLKLDWYNGGLENPGQLGSVITACAAVAAGYARHVLCFRTVWEASAQGDKGRASVTMGGGGGSGFRAGSFMQWTLPYGAASAANWIAMCAQRHFHEFGTTREQPVAVEAIGTAIHGRPSWDQWDDLTTMALRDASAMLWSRTDLTPADVDVAELYDGFSFITLAWLEALGFCGKGEGGPFIEGGERIALDGQIPLNTHGGQLSGGRLHGYGFLHEACTQLRGEGGERQVARTPAVAVAAAGGGPLAGCLLLT